MNKYFFDLTRRNWGCPWHVIIATALTSIFRFALSFSDLPAYWILGVSCLIVFIIGLSYEIYQIKKENSTARDFREDMVANIAGIALAVLYVSLV